MSRRIVAKHCLELTEDAVEHAKGSLGSDRRLERSRLGRLFSVLILSGFMLKAAVPSSAQQVYSLSPTDEIAEALVTSIVVALITGDQNLNAYRDGGTITGPITLATYITVNKSVHSFVISGSPKIDGPLVIPKVEALGGIVIWMPTKAVKFSIPKIAFDGTISSPGLNWGRYDIPNTVGGQFPHDFRVGSFMLDGPIDVPGNVVSPPMITGVQVTGVRTMTGLEVHGKITIDNAIQFFKPGKDPRSMVIKGPITVEGPVTIPRMLYSARSDGAWDLMNPGPVTINGPVTIDGDIVVLGPVTRRN